MAFETSLKTFFVKRGKIELLYKKDSRVQLDGWTSGIFSIFMDDVSILQDSDTTDDPREWKYFSYEILPGMKEFSIVY